MKSNEIEVGGHYFAKVNNRIVIVKVDGIRETLRRTGNNYAGISTYADKKIYDVTNTATGRKTLFRSAAKFRGKASPK